MSEFIGGAGSVTTQPVSGTVTSNQGTAAALSSKWPVQVTDGTNTMPTGDAAARTIHTTLDNASIAVTQASGANLHVNVDSAPTTTVVQTTGTNLHTVTDSGSVTNATLSAETTKVIGTVNIASGQSITANAGTNLNTSALALETGGNLAAIQNRVTSDVIEALQAILAELRVISYQLHTGLNTTEDPDRLRRDFDPSLVQ